MFHVKKMVQRILHNFIIIVLIQYHFSVDGYLKDRDLKDMSAAQAVFWMIFDRNRAVSVHGVIKT